MPGQFRSGRFRSVQSQLKSRYVKVKSSQSQVMSGKFRSGQVRSIQVEPGQAKSRSVQVRSG